MTTSERLSDEDLAELERLDAAATPGPWVSWIEGRDHYGGDDFIRTADEGPDGDVYVTGGGPAQRANQDLIGALRTAWPKLVAELRRHRSAPGARDIPKP